MNIVLWILQLVLAAAFFAHGWLFLFPSPEIAVQMNASLSRWFQVFLGVAEVAAAIGLTLPGLTGVQPRFVPLAAAGIMSVMISATVLHLARNEMSAAADRWHAQGQRGVGDFRVHKPFTAEGAKGAENLMGLTLRSRRSWR